MSDPKIIERRAASILEDALKQNDHSVVEALHEVCIWLAQTEDRASAGFQRKNTSHLKWRPDKVVTDPIDDDWIETGRDGDE